VPTSLQPVPRSGARSIRVPPASFQEFSAFVTLTPVLGEFLARHMIGVIEDLHNGLRATEGNTVEDIIGTPPMNINDFVRDRRDEFASTQPSTA